MHFNTYLSTSVPKIDKALFEILGRWEREITTIHPSFAPLAREFIASCKGGKRLRGTLVLLGYELAGGKPDNEIYKIAAAYEIFHTAILVHDDIIDQSDLRRGKPSLYHALGGDHYGISQAISLGDAGFFLALKIIAGSAFPDDLKNKAVRIFIDAMLDTAVGEMLDVVLPNKKNDVYEDDVVTVSRLKTARYSFASPLMVGATLAGATKNQLSRLEKFGESIGIAYQIQDDILGVFGDEKILGKSAISDMQEGKITLLFVHAKKHANKKQQEILNQYYGKKNISKSEAEKIRNIFMYTSSVDYTRRRVDFYTKNAKGTIQLITREIRFQKLLTDFTDFLVDRKK